jgi:hypothetical protein
LPPSNAPSTNEPNATSDAGIEKPDAPAIANLRNTTLPGMLATNT